MRRILLLVLAAAATLAAAQPPAGPSQDAAAVEPVTATAALRASFARRLEAERAAAGAAPLHVHPALETVAQERAQALAETGTLPEEEDPTAAWTALERRLRRAGYRSHAWTEGVVGATGTPDEAVDYWRDSDSYRQALRPDLRDLGIGVAARGAARYWVVLVAVESRVAWEREVAALADRERLRDAVLAAVNAARLERGFAPLELDPRLTTAAQAHAEDMLTRGYYDHRNPEGFSAWERVRGAGYDAHRVAENIAARHLSVDGVMDAWLRSSGHRRNILDATFTDLGVGVAVGTFDHRHQVLWVQDFARP